jgi:heme A synthase
MLELYPLLREVHFWISRVSLGIAVVMLVVAIYIGIVRKRDVTPLFRRATYAIFGLMVVEALLGLMLYALDFRPAQDVHLIYGAGAVLSLPFFIFVERTAKKRPAMGSYIWGFALLMGVVIRSIGTGA